MIKFEGIIEFIEQSTANRMYKPNGMKQQVCREIEITTNMNDSWNFTYRKSLLHNAQTFGEVKKSRSCQKIDEIIMKLCLFSTDAPGF